MLLYKKIKALVEILGLLNTFFYVSFFRKNRAWKNDVNKLKKIKSIGFAIVDSRVKTVSIIVFQTQRVTLRRFTSDIDVFVQIFVENEYLNLVDLINKSNVDVTTIVDAGANVGFATIFFNKYFPKAKFICIEPNIENVRMLKINLAKNKIHSVVYQMGLWNKKTDLYLCRDFRDGKHWSISVSEVPNKTCPVPAIDIKSIISENSITSIDLLKIDIEGSEFQIINKNVDISFLDITKFLAVEIHEDVDEAQKITSILGKFKFNISFSGEYHIASKTA